MKVVDISHIIEEGMPVYPGTEGPTIEEACTLERDGFAEKLLSMYSHTGTHIDAPAHMIKGGRTLDGFPADKYVGRGLMIDVSSIDRIGIDLLRDREKDIRKAEFLIFRCGWDRYWGEEDYFRDYPVLTEEAACWLCGMELKGVGVDAISLDRVEDGDLPIHRILLGRGFIFIENLRGLDLLPEKDFTISCLPLKIRNADGSPVRAVALLD